MNSRLSRNMPRDCMAIALGVLALSTAWAAWQHGQAEISRKKITSARLNGACYVPREAPVFIAAPASWLATASSGPPNDWTGDLFTPPALTYDAVAQVYRPVRPPAFPGRSKVGGGELLAVTREPYRAQLAGYVGASGDYRAVLVGTERSEILLARAGDRIPQLDLTLKEFTVNKVPVSPDERSPVYDFAAVASVRDERTGRELRLDSRSRELTDTPLALFRLSNAPGRTTALHAGDRFSDGRQDYLIERIQLYPPEVTIARLGSTQSGEGKFTLRPASTSVQETENPANKVRQSSDKPRK